MSNIPTDLLKRHENDVLNERQNVDVVLEEVWLNGYTAGSQDKAEKARQDELAACVNWLQLNGWSTLSLQLETARNPEVLLDQAFEACERVAEGTSAFDDVQVIRAALEKLQELQRGQLAN